MVRHVHTELVRVRADIGGAIRLCRAVCDTFDDAERFEDGEMYVALVLAEQSVASAAAFSSDFLERQIFDLRSATDTAFDMRADELDDDLVE